MASLKKCLELDAEHAQRVEKAELPHTAIRRIWRYSGGLLLPLIVGAVILSTFIVGSYRDLPQLPSPSLGTNSGG
jgi:hypothetical protein